MVVGSVGLTAPPKRGTLSRPFSGLPGRLGKVRVRETASMPTDLSEAETGGIDLYFADDLEGETFTLRDSAVYEAEEVRQEVGGDVPKFGRWLPVEATDKNGQSHGDGWTVAVGELIEELQGLAADPGVIPWTVTACRKSGPDQTDPYEVNVEAHDGTEVDQDRL
jgi:hypothetical protein